VNRRKVGLRAKPGQVRYGSAGIGSISHLSGALFAAMAQVKLTHVPYRGSGQLRAIGVGTAGRSALVPDVPTVAAPTAR